MEPDQGPFKHGKRARLALLILILVTLTLLAAATITSGIVLTMGDWARLEFGLALTLKILWGGCLLLVAGTLLTWVTIIGWKFRKLAPGQGPTALLKAVAAGVEPPAWAKSGWTSFTCTVVMVSMLGAAVLASVLIWILGDFVQFRDPLFLALKLIWASVWVLLIATVLVRLSIFARQKRRQDRERRKRPPGPDLPDGQGPRST
jgi:hypothetical protein